MLRIVTWANLYIDRKYDATVLILSVKDNQVRFNLSSCVVSYVLSLVLMAMVMSECAGGPFP